MTAPEKMDGSEHYIGDSPVIDHPTMPVDKTVVVTLSNGKKAWVTMYGGSIHALLKQPPATWKDGKPSEEEMTDEEQQEIFMKYMCGDWVEA